MNKSFAFVAAVLIGLPSFAGAYDGDPRFGGRTWYGGRRGGEQFGLLNATATPLYYRPTQRYYGNGFTVNYRYVPVYYADGVGSVTVTGASNFRTEAFRLATEDAQSWGAYSPRLTVRDSKSGAPRTAITSIIRKKTTITTTPAILPSTTDAPAPASFAAPNNP